MKDQDRITEWLPPSHENRAWLAAEVERFRRKGASASVQCKRGRLALFRGNSKKQRKEL